MISSWRPAPTRKDEVHSAKIIRLESAVNVPVVLTYPLSETLLVSRPEMVLENSESGIFKRMHWTK